MSKEEQVHVVLIGINGYGESYLRSLLDREDASIIGVVEIAAEKSGLFDVLQKKSIPIYHTIEAFYEHHEADLAIISTPIQFHTNQSMYAMEHGSHVLCEKPLTGDPSDLPIWKETAEKTGKWAAIGFNWSFTESIQALKRDIMEGVFGQAIQLKTLVLWPRTEDYFNRSAWAGRQLSPTGELIMDSIANNATAHFLHNMFYVLGEQIETSIEVNHVDAQLYRVNEIETFDTCLVKMKTVKGAELLFLASHAVVDNEGPIFQYEFEKGTVTFNTQDEIPTILAKFKDGATKDYGNPHVPHVDKLNWCIDAVKRSGGAPPCDFETAATHVHVLGEINSKLDQVRSFPEEHRKFDQETKLRYVDNVRDVLTDAYQKGAIPNPAF
ncbi:Gfo/Idh/MocA family protein [Alkalicoccobacillus porphyridii]|uniref:Gfo/Idh/MocA family oxidoreductase n=1 Tax=Alkalicoccobacillus porphyridii TaxID=2597270 RepID=A0A554A0N9_9BACI|nr:Gfo/Idh/MocA family oxidoreductase [Alkalicoccobacillus porphyridii]TSB47262.1 Gfo/Idh/MocA family oxidoreductase [Alkalicoccobacillus porphyridii]